MIGRVLALVVLVALAGCEARSFALDDDSLGTLNWTMAPIPLKDVLLQDGQLASDLNWTMAPIPLKDVLLQDDQMASDLTKAISPACKSPPEIISVPLGATGITINSPKSPSANFSACGWEFVAVPGSILSLKCKSFSLKGNDTFFAMAYEDGRWTYVGYTGKNFPTIASGVGSAYVFFMFNPKGYSSSFSCSVTSKIPCRCGIVNRSTRIVGGANTEVREYPWQVALMNSKRNIFCGATLISDRHIVTAAHCMAGQTKSSFQLLLGGHTRTKPTASEMIVKPLRFIIHPEYGVDTALNNDIAIVEITPLDFYNPKVLARPICLPDSTETYEGVMATATGWGKTSTNGSQPDILQEVDVSVVPNADCSTVYGSQVTDNMLCTSELGQKGICFGDSGGPLIAPDGANHELIGVVSFMAGVGCGLDQYYSGFARVTAEMSWIQSNTATSTTCGR